tara:strand:+ start:1242 stop:3665 length:2424 start_codon:yes stop_codon:yes gene_type:complete
MAKSGIHSGFPSQVVSDIEKTSYDYGLKVGKAIENEWFGNTSFQDRRFSDGRDTFHKLRLYARGEQSIQKYKDELSTNGDLSYLNLDWKPVPIIPKFVDIVVNGMADRLYDIKAYSRDPYGVNKRTNYMEELLADMRLSGLNNKAEQYFGMTMLHNDPADIPNNEEELELHMQLTYKQNVEIAEEEAINTLLDGSRYDLIRRRTLEDLVVLGIGASKTVYNTSEGAKVEYVDPANLIYSKTESPYFDDIYYVGEVKKMPINELVKEFPFLTNIDLEEIIEKKDSRDARGSNGSRTTDNDENLVEVLYFNYKTYMNEVYKVKQMPSGGERPIKKNDKFNPPKEKQGDYNKISRSIEVLYEGAMILGCDKLLKWEQAKNMLRPKSDFTKVKMNYSIVAPKMYDNKIESLVGRITGFADMIQLTHLKLQQVLAKVVPDGVYLDADGLAEIDLGNGTNYNPQEALNMFFQTGSVIGRSFTSDGSMNPGKMPITEISTGSGGGKMQSLIQTYNYYLQMIRDTTGLNEARDGSTPDANALVGVQKLAAANSNTATRHILKANLFLTSEIAEALSLRISDIIEYSPTRDAFIQQIGPHNVAVLNELGNLHLYDFGIFLELQPDEEEKQLLENNIQQAISQQSIELDDAIDIREIKNIKLANRVLKTRRKQKEEREQKQQQEQIEAQGEQQRQTQQEAAQLEAQKLQAASQREAQLVQVKGQMEVQKLMKEAEVKKALMDHEFQINMRLKQMETQILKSKEDSKEDRKDERTKIQASQQSKMIDQRKNDLPPTRFESSGNDIINGQFGLGAFDPK